jgi:hypothetical protein
MKFIAGDLAPRDGTYLNKETFEQAVLKAGDPFPPHHAKPDLDWDCGELRAGETVPRSGVYTFMPRGETVALKAGDVFPPFDDAAGDFVWTRELS